MNAQKKSSVSLELSGIRSMRLHYCTVEDGSVRKLAAHRGHVTKAQRDRRGMAARIL